MYVLLQPLRPDLEIQLEQLKEAYHQNQHNCWPLELEPICNVEELEDEVEEDPLSILS
jgi:putative IMPACT (imprinted ancient) family translation regulator